MSNSFPLISVIMPVYNCERFLAIAIDSILLQTYTNFELIIIDDCSTDSTPKILESYKDSRVRAIRNAENLGVTKSLNLGVSLSNGELMARMDADDISLPDRFKEQVEFMEKHTEIGVLGTQCLVIDDNGKITSNLRKPVKSEEIFYLFPYFCPIAHPSVMIRKEIFNEIQYSSDLPCAQDYDLWGKLLYTAKFANLSDVFLHYRVHDKQISNVKTNLQRSISSEILCDFLIKLGVTESVKKKADMLCLLNVQPKANKIDSIFCEIHDLNEKYFGKKCFPPDLAIVAFVAYIFKISKIMFIKNIIFSQYLKETKSRFRVFTIFFRKIKDKIFFNFRRPVKC